MPPPQQPPLVPRSDRRLLAQLHAELVAHARREYEAESRWRRRARWYVLAGVVVALGFGALGALAVHLSLAKKLDVMRNGCMTMCCQ
jgi:hypothetical protein